MERTLLLIDDDALTREMLALLLSSDGWTVFEAESGEAALEAIEANGVPDVVLSDVQMPGLSGEALATELRGACGASTRLIAMTATVKDDCGAGFDAVLQKPVDAKMVADTLVYRGVTKYIGHADDLSETMYEKFCATITTQQVAELYRFALNDAENRINRLQSDFHKGNDAEFRKEAHALKGGCGMVGAQRLANLAGVMEQEGIKPDTAAQIAECAAAIQRLRSILSAREN